MDILKFYRVGCDHCRIGSLEICAKVASDEDCDHCRIGSLETSAFRYWRMSD